MANEHETNIIAVTQAFLDGKKIQVRNWGSDGGWDCATEPCWNWDLYEYRVNPEPREVWVNVYPGGLGNCGLYPTKEAADKNAVIDRLECVKFREVID